MTLATRELTQVHRRQQLALRKATLRDMQRMWPALDWANLDSTYPRFAASVAALVSQNRKTSAGLAAAYLRAFRVASGLDGDLRIVIPQTLPAEQFTTSLRVTSLVAAKNAASQAVAADVAMGNALSQASGAMARLVLNAGRETVLESIKADPKATGWQRILGGTGCEFCQMLAGRGAVYKEGTAGFEAHDHCGCTTEPVYG